MLTWFKSASPTKMQMQCRISYWWRGLSRGLLAGCGRDREVRVEDNWVWPPELEMFTWLEMWVWWWDPPSLSICPFPEAVIEAQINSLSKRIWCSSEDEALSGTAGDVPTPAPPPFGVGGSFRMRFLLMLIHSYSEGKLETWNYIALL